MPSYTELALFKANDFTTGSSTSHALYTKPSGTFDATETSMYSEVISLASTTNYGGASLGNQSERYLMAVATIYTSGGNQYDYNTTTRYNNAVNNSWSFEDYFSDRSSYTFTPTGATFSAIQTNLEDDGKHFIQIGTSSDTANDFALIVDKNTLGGSGSSSSSSTSAMSWAYSSQSATDPNVLLDWTTPTPDYSVTADITDWKTDILTKVSNAGLNIEDVIADYMLEQSIALPFQKSNFKDYVNKKLN